MSAPAVPGRPSPAVGAPPLPEPWRSTLHEVVARALRRDGAALDPSRPLIAQGLDSLAACEIASGVEAAFGTPLDIACLLDGASLADVAAAVASGAARPHAASGPPVPPVPAATFGQRAIWFLQRLEPAAAAYNLAAAFRVRSPLDTAAFERAWTALAARHEALRASFPAGDGGEPVLQVAAAPSAAVVSVDASPWSAGELAAALADAAHRPFDLERGPLLRAELFAAGVHGDACLLIAFHHIVTDLPSLRILARDLARLYERELAAGAGRPQLPPAAGGGLARYAAWEERQARGPDSAAHWRYWSEALGGDPPDLDLPADHPRPPRRRFAGAACRARLDPALAGSVAALARQSGTTLFAALLAGFQAVLHRHSGLDDVLVGTPVSCRAAAGAGETVGYLVNPLVLRGRFVAAPAFAGTLAAAQAALAGALRHQGLPLPLLVERLRAGRDAARSPLFQALFVLHRAAAGEAAADEALLAGLALGVAGERWDLGGTSLETAPLATRSSQLDLSLAAAERRGEIVLRLVFDSDLFDGATAERLLGHFRTLLAAAAADPGRRVAELPLLSPGERSQLAAWNATEAPFRRAACVHELFAQQAERTPAAVALLWEEERITYRELAARAAATAAGLRALGVGLESRVGLLLGRTPELVASLLGALAAGAAFVPLDDRLPARRLAWLARDAALAALVVDAGTAGLLPDVAVPRLVCGGAPVAAAGAPRPRAAPDNIAYVLYTSGSTGWPKGVEVQQRALVNILEHLMRDTALGPGDVVLSFTTPSFDIGILELLLPLVAGARLDLAPVATGRDGAAFAAALAAHRPTLTQATPASWSLLLEDPPPRRAELRAFCGGEAMSGALADGLRALAGRAWNMYGPTETAVYSVIFELAAGEGAPPIGRPVANTRCHLLSAAGEAVPTGVPGELHIAGDGVARGYLGRPELTAERFLPDPFSPVPGGRLYRTGDLARRRADGTIDYLGRIDRQVKIRGNRVELGEVEERLRDHPGVRAAIVAARPDAVGEPRLVAYYLAAVPPPAPDDLARFLRERLPEPMVPAAFVALAALPLLPSGKVDLRALPDPVLATAADGAARSPLEEWVLAIWAGVLGVAGLGRHDNFFAAGGHSLKAAQVIARVRKVFGVELPLRDLFEAPTAAAFARRVAAARGGGAPLPTPAGAEGALAAAAGGAADVSAAQRRLWLLDRLHPGQAAYNMPAALHLAGVLDVAALAAALGEIVRRHEVLRTRYPAVAGEPRAVIEPVPDVLLGVVDLSALPQPAAVAHGIARAEASRPCDLAAGPVLRCRLLCLAADCHLLLVAVHHIAADGASLALFVAELDALYTALAAGAAPPLPPLPLRYADFAAWERRVLTDELRERHLGYWRSRLAAAEALELPADHPRRALPGFRGVRVSARLGRGETAQALALARREGLTPFVVLAAALALLLHRSTGQRLVIVGTPFDGRDRVELEPLIGLFAQLLPLPLSLDEAAPGVDLLRAVRDQVLAAWEHRRVSFEALAQEGLAPLPQATLTWERAAAAHRIGPLAARLEEVENGSAKFDLSLFARETGGQLALTLVANADLFLRPTAARLLGHLQHLLAALLAQPERPLADLPLLSAAERWQLLGEWNDTAGPAAAAFGTVCDAFEAQAASAPHAVAVALDAEVLTYGELDRRAGRLARRLRRLGVAPETLVALLLPRSSALVLAAVAVLKAGGAYLPLDPEHPAERAAAMLADSGARVLVTAAEAAADLAFAGTRLDLDRVLAAADDDAPVEGAAAPRPSLTADNLAYVVYTSGSTGRPKGVALSQGGLANLVGWHLRAYGVERADRATLVASPAFDASVWEMWPCLCAGASLAPLPAARLAPPAALAAALERLAVTIAFLPTPLAEALLGERGTALPPSLRLLLTGGDRLQRAYAAGATRLVNHYGPTEATVVATAAPVAAGRRGAAPPPIGRPIENLAVHVLDGRLRPVPIGVAGELHVAGRGLARGYLHQPAATADRFRPSPFAAAPGERLYRTGDRARLLADGSLEFQGRADRQVKIRGVRIEPAEIESLLLAQPGVRQAVVAVAVDAHLGPFLCAYVVARHAAAPPAAAELRTALQAALPAAMVPAAFVLLPALPVNANGKIDLAALPVPDRAGDGAACDDGTPPGSALEEILAAIWCELLGRPQVGIHADFFALGGNSLQTARLQARIQEELGVELPLATILRRTTIAQLAEALAERLAASLDEETLQNLFNLTGP